MKKACLIVFLFRQALLIGSIDSNFESYWYQGAEISTYDLKQFRYGEQHSGHSVLLYVTENFLGDLQVKHESGPKVNLVPILKLNHTKKFITGIYPYSVLTSTFHPLDQEQPLKITGSIQEWCGHTWTQFNNRKDWIINTFSYFQEEGDQVSKLPMNWTENGLWTLIRLSPKDLPVGFFGIIPSITALRFQKLQTNSFLAEGSLIQNSRFLGVGSFYNEYRLSYKNLGRRLSLWFEPFFPYKIVGWRESYLDTDGNQVGESVATFKTSKTINYWDLNKNKDRKNRKNLQLN